MGMRRTDSEEALTLTLSPNSINLTEAINAIDTALSVCSPSCVNGEETDETEASPAVSMEWLVFDQASVGDNTDQSADKVVASTTPEPMQHDVVSTGAHEATAKGSSELVSGASATTATTDALKVTVDVLAAELSSIHSELLGDGLDH